MQNMKTEFYEKRKNIIHQKGFTITELLIAMVVSSIVLIGAFSTYTLQSKAYSTQHDISTTQQNLRAAAHVLAWDLHNSQRDPRPNRQNFIINAGLVNGNSTLSFVSRRLDEVVKSTGLPGQDGEADTDQTITYWIADLDGDGLTGLYRDASPEDPNGQLGPQLVADGVQAFGVAYAFDRDNDGVLERYNNPSARILWATDTDGNGDLDAILDPNDDGVTDEIDDTFIDEQITNLDDPLNHMATPVQLRQVRAVRIFLLGVSERQAQDNMIDNNTYAIGHRLIEIDPPDRFKRRMLTFDVALRNY